MLAAIGGQPAVMYASSENIAIVARETLLRRYTNDEMIL